MEKYLENLNPQQYKAVTTNNQYVRVIAGAGSGKTRVLTTRILHLMESWGVDQRKILAITFTNKAAKEMKDRISNMLEGKPNKMQISTIHSFCVALLRQEIVKEGYPRTFTIMDEDDQKAIIKEGYKLFDINSKNCDANSVINYIGGMKGAGFGPDSALERAYNPIERQKAKLYEYYCQRQQQLYALDFDDLLLWSIRILKKYPDSRSKWSQKYQFILVDEFQDIDDQQYELIHLLANENTYLYVVGDPDQTIYTWRGANVNIIMDFEDDYKPCETIILNQNYRSTSNILNAANSLIKYNKHRVAKDLFTANNDGKKVINYTSLSDDNEANYVTNRIMDYVSKGGSYADCTILYRSNYLSRAFERALVDNRIPYVIYGGTRFYDRKEIKDALAYLRIIVNGDDLAFKRIINVPKRGIGEATLDALLKHGRENGVSMLEAINTVELSKRALNTLKAFYSQVEEWKKRKDEVSMEQLLEIILDESGYRLMLETSLDEGDEDRLENLKELINDIYAFHKENPDATLEEYLQMVTLYSEAQNDVEGEFVRLMTVHSAKGLEFDNVYLVGFSDGIFPSQRSMDESGSAGLEEERRLAYVAITRARKTLYITSNSGYSYVSSGEKHPSRFLKEIDEQCIEKINPRMPAPKPLFVDYGDDQHDYIPISKPVTNKVSTKYKNGDMVIHDDFGEGVIVKIDKSGKFADIAFPYPYKIKTISLSFPKLHKKG